MKPDFLSQQLQRQQQQAQQMQQRMLEQQQQQRLMGALANEREQKRRLQEQDQQAAKAASAQARAPSGAPAFQADPRFAQVERDVENLRQDLAAGKIDENGFQQQASALMIQDQQGAWWMVGAQSGSWYRYDGVGWSQATPPGQYLQSIDAAAAPKISEAPKRRACFWRLLATLFVLGLGLAVFGELGFLVGSFLEETVGELAPVIGAGAIWLFGLWATLRLAGNQWRK